MSVPTHKASCLTRAFKTRCRYCNEEVYYFFCTCGSKLLFESLGSPWPIHYCLDEVEDLIDVVTDTYGKVDQAAINRIIRISEERGLKLSAESLTKLNNYLRKNDNKPVRRRIKPNDIETLVVGQIISINRNINFYKRLNIQNSVIGKQLMGMYGKESFAEIIIRTNPDTDNVIEEYEIILPESLVKKLILREKDYIATKINTQSIAVSGKLWQVEYIDKIK